MRDIGDSSLGPFNLFDFMLPEIKDRIPFVDAQIAVHCRGQG